eukprot:gb/GECH01010245.1/.p1 GENE.gb/GECH01010245.1/~~gb/GECH01010245.1/.p1  ORF type:complete len:209 (+),score=25.30 gb/GECH01010245.1/:1-627(+)
MNQVTSDEDREYNESNESQESTSVDEDEDCDESETEVDSDDECPFKAPAWCNCRPGYTPRRQTCRVCHHWQKDEEAHQHMCSNQQCNDFFNCPTRYLNGHPEEKARRKQVKKDFRKHCREWIRRGKEIRKVGRQGARNARFRSSDADIGPEVIHRNVSALREAITGSSNNNETSEARTSEIEELKNSLEQERLRLEIAKLRNERQKYE